MPPNTPIRAWLCAKMVRAKKSKRENNFLIKGKFTGFINKFKADFHIMIETKDMDIDNDWLITIRLFKLAHSCKIIIYPTHITYFSAKSILHAYSVF